MVGRSISKVEIRFKGGSGDEGPSASSKGLDAPPKVPSPLRPTAPLVSGFELLTPVDADDSGRLGLAVSGAEATLLPFGTREGPLFLLRLADRGIFQVEGDGDGNMSAMANERLEIGSCMLLDSISGWGVAGGTTVWNPMAVDGLLRFDE